MRDETRKRNIYKSIKKIIHSLQKFTETSLTEYWKRIIASDQNKFQLFKLSSISIVWRKKNKSSAGEKCRYLVAISIIKYGRGNIMVYGCIAWNNFGNIQTSAQLC